MNAETKNDRDLKQIIIWGSALPTGVIMAALQALQRDFSFQISGNTFTAFILGTAVVLAFWKIIFDNRPAVWRIAASVVVIAMGISAFLYPMRFVSPARLNELFTGLASAVCALSIMAIMMLKLRNFFDEDDRTNTPIPVTAPKI